MTVFDGVNKRHLCIYLTLFLKLNSVICGTVEAIKTNLDVPVNQTAKLQWRVLPDIGEEISTADAFVFGSPKVQILQGTRLVSTITTAGAEMFGSRLSGKLSNGIYTLSIKKIKFNEKKSFNLDVLFRSQSGVDIKSSKVVIKEVVGGPIFCGANISKSSRVIEGTALTLKQDVCGNPKPDVQWKMSSDSRYMPSESSVLKENITRSYQYTFTTKGLTRTNCGHLIEFRASGYKPDITEQTIININFKPSVATAIAYYQDNCVHVNWKAEDTGNCKVTYQLTFNTGQTFEVTGNTFKRCSQGILRSTSVNIRGIYNNQRGDKSEDVFSSTRPPSPSKKDNNLCHTVTIPLILVFVLVVVIVLLIKGNKLCKRNFVNKHQLPLQNAGARNDDDYEVTVATSSHYADLNPQFITPSVYAELTNNKAAQAASSNYAELNV